jgi:hypothetical protein
MLTTTNRCTQGVGRRVANFQKKVLNKIAIKTKTGVSPSDFVQKVWPPF